MKMNIPDYAMDWLLSNSIINDHLRTKAAELKGSPLVLDEDDDTISDDDTEGWNAMTRAMDELLDAMRKANQA